MLREGTAVRLPLDCIPTTSSPKASVNLLVLQWVGAGVTLAKLLEEVGDHYESLWPGSTLVRVRRADILRDNPAVAVRMRTTWISQRNRPRTPNRPPDL